VKKPDTIIDDIHTTRRNIEKKTKNMTRSERTAFYNQAGITAAKKYEFKRIVRARQKV